MSDSQSDPPRDPHGPESRSGGPPHRRRMPPPDYTGLEADYLLECKEARRPLRVEMLDGEEFQGVIEYYDRDMIKLTRPEGPSIFIRKVHIRTIQELS